MSAWLHTCYDCGLGRGPPGAGAGPLPEAKVVSHILDAKYQDQLWEKSFQTTPAALTLSLLATMVWGYSDMLCFPTCQPGSGVGTMYSYILLRIANLSGGMVAYTDQ